jgi:hypothetical protein
MEPYLLPTYTSIGHRTKGGRKQTNSISVSSTVAKGDPEDLPPRPLYTFIGTVHFSSSSTYLYTALIFWLTFLVVLFSPSR